MCAMPHPGSRGSGRRGAGPANQQGFNPQVLAGMVFQESGFKSFIF